MLMDQKSHVDPSGPPRPGAKRLAHHRRVAFLRGDVQRRLAILVDRIDVNLPKAAGRRVAVPRPRRPALPGRRGRATATLYASSVGLPLPVGWERVWKDVDVKA